MLITQYGTGDTADQTGTGDGPIKDGLLQKCTHTRPYPDGPSIFPPWQGLDSWAPGLAPEVCQVRYSVLPTSKPRQLNNRASFKKVSCMSSERMNGRSSCSEHGDACIHSTYTYTYRWGGLHLPQTAGRGPQPFLFFFASFFFSLFRLLCFLSWFSGRSCLQKSAVLSPFIIAPNTVMYQPPSWGKVQ